MGRFVEGADLSQLSVLPECLEDWVDEDNPVQVIEAFVEALDLPALGFDGIHDVRIGRLVELEADDPAKLEALCEKLLANTLIEDYEIVEDGE